MDDLLSLSAPTDPSDPAVVDEWLRQQEDVFAELIAGRLTVIVREAYDDFLATLPNEEVITAAGDLFAMGSIVPRWRSVVTTALIPRLNVLYLTGSISAFTTASGRVDIPESEVAGWARVVNEQAVAYAATATNRLAGVGDTVYDLIRRRTARAIERGATNEQLKREIERIGRFSEFRADTVARTEVGMAYGAGDNNGMVALGEFGPAEKEWLGTFDGRSRPWHAEASGQRRPMNQPFDVGGEQMMYAKQSGASARNVVNCRCTTLYHFAGDRRPDGSIVGESPAR
jgi:uncharacterized protein with gpF-like domain